MASYSELELQVSDYSDKDQPGWTCPVNAGEYTQISRPTEHDINQINQHIYLNITATVAGFKK